MAAASGTIPPKAARRIQRELTEFMQSPPPFVPKMAVDNANIRHMYFLIEGPPDSPYFGGEYVLRAELPSNYPMAAPVLRMLTPSGRFEVNMPICTTFTHYHPESWSPTYNFTNILISFVSFMLDDTPGSVGSIITTAAVREAFAKESKSYNAIKGYYDMWV